MYLEFKYEGESIKKRVVKRYELHLEGGLPWLGVIFHKDPFVIYENLGKFLNSLSQLPHL